MSNNPEPSRPNCDSPEPATLIHPSLLQSVAEAAADAIVLMDETRRVCFWNRAAEFLFGHAKAQALGRAFDEIVLPERFRPSFQEAFPHFARADCGPSGCRRQELLAVRSDGVEFPIELSVGVVREAGKWYAVGTVRDISDRKAMEEELAETARMANENALHLEEAIARANQLALEAQMASVAKSEFVANMSHELRTPLNGVIGMTTLLLETDLTRDQRDFTEIIRSSGEALLAVVNDILDFSKIEAGKLDLECIEFDLRYTVEQVGEMLGSRAQEKGVEFVILIHHDVPEHVKGDPARLRQVLINLAGNAVKFTEAGEIVVSVRVADSNGSLVALRFDVTDTGIGIPADRIDALFDPFTQADSSTTRKYGGTGLGLTISKRLVTAMGGEIGVNSRPGAGSQFFFTVKLESVPCAAPSVTPEPDSLKGFRLLLVDPFPANHAAYVEQLKPVGAAMDRIETVDEAIHALHHARNASVPYDLVVVDHSPRLDGREVAARIKAEPSLAHTRLILVTSWPRRGDAAEMQRLGYEAYLVKPVKRDHLIKAIATVAGRAVHADAGRASPIVTRHSLNETYRRGGRILLAEDNPTNQKIAARMLEKLGHHCDVADNGQEALNAAVATHYDLILMDCQMPKMDGFEAAKAIREARGASSRAPIVALTGSTLRSDHDACRNAGMDAVLTKPLLREALERILKTYLPCEIPRASGTSDSPEPPAVEPPLNLNRFREITLGNAELECELLSTFVADTTKRLSAMAEALAAGDGTLLAATAHALKGSAGNLGAHVVQGLALQVEQTAKADDFGAAADSLRKLNVAVARTRDFLEGLLNAKQ